MISNIEPDVRSALRACLHLLLPSCSTSEVMPAFLVDVRSNGEAAYKAHIMCAAGGEFTIVALTPAAGARANSPFCLDLQSVVG